MSRASRTLALVSARDGNVGMAGLAAFDAPFF
jgi:hypothetical protein